MSDELEVGFAWTSTYLPEKIHLLIHSAAGIYKDPFNSVNNHEYSTYEMQRSKDTSSINIYSFKTVVSLRPGMYHFVFRVCRNEDIGNRLVTSDFYDKTVLASGQEVNYVEIMGLNHNRIANDTTISRDDSTYDTAQENLSCKTPLLDYYDEDEQDKCHMCCTLL